jgi:hypothetical protein
MSNKCDYCSSTNTRLSRFRLSDILELLVFQYPIRCYQCGERSFANIFDVFGTRLRRERV